MFADLRYNHYFIQLRYLNWFIRLKFLCHTRISTNPNQRFKVYWVTHFGITIREIRGNVFFFILARIRSHYGDVIMGMMASQITSLTLVYSTVYSGADQKKTSKHRVTGLCAGNSPVNSSLKGTVTRKMIPFDDVTMAICILLIHMQHSSF